MSESDRKETSNTTTKIWRKPAENKSVFSKLLNILFGTATGKPQTKEDLIELLRSSTENKLIDRNSLHMLEGVLEVHDLRVKDVMLPRSQMVTIDYTLPLNDILNIVIKSGHSRFPVLGENKDGIIGILLAKDLLAYTTKNKNLVLKDILRIAEFIPESKRLDTLLQDFRLKRNHMAVVVDEYGSVTGLITIEDVIEQIVGDIEDEHDAVDAPLIKKRADNTFTLKSLTTLEEFNDFFNTKLFDSEVETMGGLVLKTFGHLPKKDECVKIENYTFKVLKADDRRINLLQVIPPKIENNLSE